MTSPTPARIALTVDRWVRDPAHRGNASPAVAARATLLVIVKYLERQGDGLSTAEISSFG
jgi:hypothetical protein